MTGPSNGAPITTATMSIAGTTENCDLQGNVLLQGLSATTGAMANFSADGYVATARRVNVIANNEATLDVEMLPIGTTQMIDTTTENVVSHGDGSVTIPANAIVDAQGGAVSSAQVQVTTALPSDPGYTAFFPGPFIGARESDNAEGPLLSYGFVDVILQDTAGNPLQLAQDQLATMTFPIDADADPGTATVPLWYYDTVQGIWIEEGTATRNDVDGVYQGDVTHFSPINVDVWAQSGIKCVTVEDANGNPVVGARVIVDGFQVRQEGDTDSNGTVCVTVPADVDFLVWVRSGTTVTTPISERVGSGQTLNNTIVLLPTQTTLTLTWGTEVPDLDIHLSVPTTPARTHIYKANHGSLDESPYALLDPDVTTGSGPEVTTVRRLLPGTYRCAVHNYSGQTQELGICNSGARLVLDAPEGDLHRAFTPPQHNANHMNNNVWLVFDLVVAEDDSLTLNPLDVWGTTDDFHPGGG